jgi:predicted Zn-dependent protease
MTVETEQEPLAKRRLILRDALTFLTLTLITAVLFAITLFLFRSFATHRQDLAQRWAARGQAALSSGNPDQAIVALRTALSYAPGERAYELQLAQALGDAGHVDESFNYFLGLWETQPGDGFINLRLARLAAKKNDMQGAINYYRAAIYGTWEGDGVVRRRDVRLELARYLIAHNDLSSARNELLVAGGNAPDNVEVEMVLAQLLEQAGAPRDALSYYRKVLSQEPGSKPALLAAGRLEYESGNFDEAHRLLEDATQDKAAAGSEEILTPAVTGMISTSARVMAIAPSKKLSPDQRAARILHARDVAKKRFESCNAQIAAASGISSPLQSLGVRWMSKEATLGRAAFLQDATAEDSTMRLVYDTEVQTSQVCGAPTGDDELLLLLAKSSREMDK